jgi:ABC-type branched-subunit amino acid transport system substrate-binding protein
MSVALRVGLYADRASAKPNRLIVYTAPAPNQQIIPAVTWALDNLERRFFLVGSDYVFPQTANALIRHVADAIGAEIVGEAYAPLGARDLSGVVDSIGRARPDVILNTINGDSNAAFFQALRRAGSSPAAIPAVSFSIAEPELAAMGAKDFVGDYAAWNCHPDALPIVGQARNAARRTAEEVDRDLCVGSLRRRFFALASTSGPAQWRSPKAATIRPIM